MHSAALALSDRYEIQPGAINASILAGAVSASTIKKYTSHFRHYLEFAGDMGAAVQASTLARWRAHLANETEQSPNYINSQIAAVKSLISEAAKQGIVSHETAAAFDDVDGVRVKALKSRQKRNARTRISPAQMRAMVESPELADIVGARDRALLLTMASSGCRIGEVCAMRRDDIQQRDSDSVVMVLGKNKTEPEQAPISSEAVAAIDAWLAVRSVESPYIFTAFSGANRQQRPAPLSPVGAWKIVQRHAQRSGLAHIKPHDFRRFVGTQLARVDIRQAQRALRHERLETTARHYVLDDLDAGLTENLF